MAFRIKCSYCSTTSIFKVKSYHEKVIDSLNWRPYCFIVCDNCENGSLVSFHINSGYQHLFTDFAKDSVVYDFSKLEEALLVPENKLSAPEHLPKILNETYLDAEFNFSSSRWKAAAQLYLQSIEFACIAAKSPHDEIESENLSAQRIDLTKRINNLFEEGLISERMKNWAHKVRVLGQYHKHRYVEANEDDTKDIREFCELFLKYLFTIPGIIQSREKRLEARKDRS